jgi:cytochrome c oxidase cbb3-type subunit III
MNPSHLLRNILLASLLLGAFTIAAAQTAASSAPPANANPPGNARQQNVAPGKTYDPDLIEQGSTLFRQDCSFCHGRDAGGGETGPDLTRSRLVHEDVDGDKIGPVVVNGRPDEGMPPFDRSPQQISALVAFLHTQQKNASTREGGRKGVDAADLQTGNVEAGKRYFEGAGGCATCHSPAGDLAGIASRLKGLELERQMLYPKHPKSRVTVTLASGQTIAGMLEYLDEFTVALIDSAGSYRSWRIRDVQYKVDAPVNAHVDLFSKYTDADIHNLMAYLQTLQ